MGVAEQAKGRVKEAVASLTDNEQLKAEGEAQAQKGAEETKETKARAEAKLHEKKAEMYDAKQEAAEG